MVDEEVVVEVDAEVKRLIFVFFISPVSLLLIEYNKTFFSPEPLILKALIFVKG